MEKYALHEVKTAAHRREFLQTAATLYRNDPTWVQPLDNDIEAVFDPARNKLFADGEAIRWILKDRDGNAVGRIAAFYNREKAAAEDQPTGGCGFFECIDDQQAADQLFDAARTWLAARGMEAMDGPVNFGDRMMWWGALVEGFTLPLYGMPYNPPYYEKLFEGYGFQNYFNQYSYLRVLTIGIMPEALYEKARRLYENPDYDFRTVDLSDIRKLAYDFRTVYNSGWAAFTGVRPMTEPESIAHVRELKPIIDPRVAYFAYYQGQPIGFFIMIPDINQIFRHLHGKFGLWQKLRFLIDLKLRRRCDRLYGVVFGVASEFQGRGVEAGMIRCFERFVEQNPTAYQTLEMAWVGDFNPLMMRVCESYVMAVKHKRHVTYRYLFDRSKPFTRAPRLGKAARKPTENQ